MRAVDTNLIVRYITRDDPKQAAIAGRIVGSERIWVAKTVLLESEWVLRGVYEFSATEVLAALQALLGLPNVSTEDAEAVAAALSWAQGGMDFADALHAASAGPADRFITFDADLVKKAKKLGVAAVMAG